MISKHGARLFVQDSGNHDSVFHLDEQVPEISKQADVAVAQTVSLRCFRCSLVTGESIDSLNWQALSVVRETWLKRRKLTVCATVTRDLIFFRATHSSENCASR